MFDFTNNILWNKILFNLFTLLAMEIQFQVLMIYTILNVVNIFIYNR